MFGSCFASRNGGYRVRHHYKTGEEFGILPTNKTAKTNWDVGGHNSASVAVHKRSCSPPRLALPPATLTSGNHWLDWFVPVDFINLIGWGIVSIHCDYVSFPSPSQTTGICRCSPLQPLTPLQQEQEPLPLEFSEADLFFFGAGAGLDALLAAISLDSAGPPFVTFL